MHEVRRVVRGRAAVQVPRAEQVRLEPLVDRRVEADGGGRVDRHVDVAGELGLRAAEVAVEHVDLLVEPGKEPSSPPKRSRRTSNEGLRDR